MGLRGVRSGRGMLFQCPCHADRNPSMKVDWSDNAPDFPVLVNCKAGCETSNICKSMGDPTGASLYPAREQTKVFVGEPSPVAQPETEPRKRKDDRPKTEIVRYVYTDEKGVPLFIVIRYRYDDEEGGKTFKQVRPDGTAGIEGVRRVLYRLHVWHQNPKLKGGIAIVEGEKDVETLVKWGLPATTNMGGAGNWRPEYAQQLKDAGITRVRIIPDNDDAGRKHAEVVAIACAAVGITPYIVTLPNLPEKGDVTDWVEAGGTRDALLKLVHDSPEWKPVGKEPLFMTAQSIDDLDQRPVEFLIEGVLPLGWLGAIAGRDGRGKSFLGLEIARCVLTGKPLFDEFPVNKQGKVLLVLLDDNENLIRERIEDMGLSEYTRGADPKLIIATEKHVKINGENNLEVLLQIQQWADQHEPVFMMIDALYKFFPASRGSVDSANSAAAMMPIITAFNRIGERSNCTVALVSHDNKAGSDIQGSQVIRNMYKWILRLILPPKYDKDPEEGKVSPDRVLQLEKLKIGGATAWGLKILGAGVREDGRPRRDIRWERIEIERKQSRHSKKAELRQRIVDWLKFFLETGPKYAADVREAAFMDGNRFRWRDVNDAAVAEEAGVEKVHPNAEAPWIWRLKEKGSEQVPAVQPKREGEGAQSSLPGTAGGDAAQP